MEMGFCKTGSTFLWQAKLSKGWSQINDQEEKKKKIRLSIASCMLVTFPSARSLSYINPLGTTGKGSSWLQC